MTKVKVLFVCLGNICRSPLAEAVFIHKIKARGIAHAFEVASCGTSNYHVGDTPDKRTIANALRNGVTIDHKGRQLAAHDLDYYDKVIAMDYSNHGHISKLDNFNAHSQKVVMMRAYDTIEKGSDVPDPYYGNESHFQEVFDILDRSMDALIDELYDPSRN